MARKIKLHNTESEHIANVNETPENLIMLHSLYKLQVMNSNENKYKVERVR